MAMHLDGHKRRAADLMRTHHPACELGGERCLALAALSANHGIIRGISFQLVTLRADKLEAYPTEQQPLQRKQLPAASNKTGCGHRW